MPDASAFTYNIVWTEEAAAMLADIADNRIRLKIVERADELSHEPQIQGKPLSNELQGYRSVRAVGQRYRIIYTINEQTVIVSIMWTGIRKEGSKHDVYSQASRRAARAKLKRPHKPDER